MIPTDQHGDWWTRRWSQPVSPRRKWLGVIVVGIAAYIIAPYDIFGLYPDLVRR